MEVWRQRHKIKYNTHTSNSKQELINTKKHWPKLRTSHKFNLCVQEYAAHVCIYFENEKAKTTYEHEIYNNNKKKSQNGPKIGFISDWMVNGIFRM